MKEAQIDREKWGENNKGQQIFERAAVASVWLTVVSDLLNGTTLSIEDFRDNLRIHFVLQPQGLIHTRNKCG